MVSLSFYLGNGDCQGVIDCKRIQLCSSTHSQILCVPSHYECARNIEMFLANFHGVPTSVRLSLTRLLVRSRIRVRALSMKCAVDDLSFVIRWLLAGLSIIAPEFGPFRTLKFVDYDVSVWGIQLTVIRKSNI